MQTGQVRYLTVYGTGGTPRADYIISLEGDRDGRYEDGRGVAKRGEGRGGWVWLGGEISVFSRWGGGGGRGGGGVCCAHPRAHQRNHPPTIDYYLSNLHSNRALVQICTPHTVSTPFGNPLQILLHRCDLLVQYRFCYALALFFFNPHPLARSRSIVLWEDGAGVVLRIFLANRENLLRYFYESYFCGECPVKLLSTYD